MKEGKLSPNDYCNILQGHMDVLRISWGKGTYLESIMGNLARWK